MRIRVRRTGGFAGIERRAEVDTSGRPDAQEWQSLAERALASGRDTPPAGVPDGFSYEITVDGRTVYAADPRLTEAQRELVSRVLKEGA
ncbi:MULTISPECIES: protealysin inhibitor emfourin [Streptomyces]|uniref:Protealysin inhibitor emfourin n=1 Tax=Streptomyces flaveolus TaxID=67297 RepID=A0ABV3AAK4_9ACTN|nr:MULTISPECIES: protealysin inhibitor emfourin [Streptomyces]KMS81542.1 metalloprotease [Streptomyces regensis]KOG73633.1 metalloprotease [Streptomyces antibioticus]KOV75658.1 metalloprotease [Streptomyces sp. NRRL WC-3723]